MKSKNEAPASVSALEIFQEEDRKNRAEAEIFEREMSKKRGDWEKKLVDIKAKREKAAAALEQMIGAFERIEAEEQTAQLRRASPQVNKKSDVQAGRISLDEYYRTGVSDQELVASARSETEKKLGFLLQEVRVKSLEVLQLDVDEAAGERELMYLATYPATLLLERMRASVKNMEAALMSGMSGGMHSWDRLDQKKGELARATGKALTGEIWRELDLAAVKRLRFDAGLPDSEMAALMKIIGEMEAGAGSKVDLVFKAFGDKGVRGLSVLIWR